MKEAISEQIDHLSTIPQEVQALLWDHNFEEAKLVFDQLITDKAATNNVIAELRSQLTELVEKIIATELGKIDDESGIRPFSTVAGLITKAVRYEFFDQAKAKEVKLRISEIIETEIEQLRKLPYSPEMIGEWIDRAYKSGLINQQIKEKLSKLLEKQD